MEMAEDFVFATIDVPGASITAAHGINYLGQIVGLYIDNSGQIVGWYADGTGNHGFSGKDSFTTINVPGAEETGASDINNRGQIVGPITTAQVGTDSSTPIMHSSLLTCQEPPSPLQRVSMT
jgi:uncharacterized membrane protein